MPLERFKIAWLGKVDDGGRELLERVKAVCDARGQQFEISTQSSHDWNPEQPNDADRILVACENRIDYPWKTAALLQTRPSHVPWGVVTGVWHAGARRTGIGPVTHWQLPWYRWWDGWRGWFFPELARPQSFCATQFEAVTLPIDLATPSSVGGDYSTMHDIGDAGDVTIVAACQHTAETWRLIAQRTGWTARAVRPMELSQIGFKTFDHGDDCSSRDRRRCILWDDSCQDRLPMTERTQQSYDQCRLLALHSPGVPIMVALAIGHIFAWPQLKTAGASDFFIKPSHSLPLADYLYSLSTLSAASVRTTNTPLENSNMRVNQG